MNIEDTVKSITLLFLSLSMTAFFFSLISLFLTVISITTTFKYYSLLIAISSMIVAFVFLCLFGFTSVLYKIQRNINDENNKFQLNGDYIDLDK